MAASQPTQMQKNNKINPPSINITITLCCTWVVWVCLSSPVHLLLFLTLAYFLRGAPGPSLLSGWSCCSLFGLVQWHQGPATERDACRDRQKQDERNWKTESECGTDGQRRITESFQSCRKYPWRFWSFWQSQQGLNSQMHYFLSS